MEDVEDLLKSLKEFQEIFPMFYFNDCTNYSWCYDGDEVKYLSADCDDLGVINDWEYAAEVWDSPKQHKGYFICNIDLGTGDKITVIFDESKRVE